MRSINESVIIDAVRDMCVFTAYNLPKDVGDALRAAAEKEESPLGREVLERIIENSEIAAKEGKPICQDTGLAVFFVEYGADICIEHGSLTDAINEGVRRGYRDGYLRKSVVKSPLDRVNTGDNTPAIIHIEETPGDKLVINMMAKGGGCENMSRHAMLWPGDGEEGIKHFVVDSVEKAGANPCPPIIVGVGIGGDFEISAMLSKKALLRKLGSENPDPALAGMEKEILLRINQLGIGPQGFGGTTTALGVHIISHPCHIASLPVAVNIECHAHRHAKVIL